jgi:hypothetical protein
MITGMTLCGGRVVINLPKSNKLEEGNNLEEKLTNAMKNITKTWKRGMISVSPEFFFNFLCFAFKAETQYDFLKMIRIELN